MGCGLSSEETGLTTSPLTTGRQEKLLTAEYAKHAEETGLAVTRWVNGSV